MKVKILDSTVDPAFNIEMAARTCYNSRHKIKLDKRIGFIKGLINAGHQSILENAIVTFDVNGVSRALLAQLSRHRLISLCVESQRYCKLKNEPEWVYPNDLKQEQIDILCKGYNECYGIYCKLLENGIKPEDARYILPMGTPTNLTMTVNFRELRHILKLRLDSKAQWEIQDLCKEIVKLLDKKGWSWLYDDFYNIKCASKEMNVAQLMSLDKKSQNE